MSPSTDFDLSRELEVARELAFQAGAILLEVYATEFTVWQKPGGAGPVTDADARANELIVAALHREFPGDAVIAEESAGPAAAHGPRCWYVDPLDGTREFVDRNGMFAVQIGLAIGGEPALGVVFAPASGKLYTATAGGPCMLEHEGSRRRLHVAEAPERTENLRLVVSRSHRSNRTELIRARLGIHHVAQHGSVGIKCGLIAEGLADLYLHPSGRSYRWDTCGPEAVLRAAGGVLTDFAGARYRYDGTELENRRGIVACSAGAFPAVLPIAREVAESAGLLPPT
ncbi:MAG TPA: 3'(2'),5'-bisphosphate nucleotidase CysQ [Myxococcaceae bacterium]|nr:3'(2'),5'-bisphosphate nucleotidase CysQ [Myxococcaceae bacterium]